MMGTETGALPIPPRRAEGSAFVKGGGKAARTRAANAAKEQQP